jgi:hypothetical protein
MFDPFLTNDGLNNMLVYVYQPFAPFRPVGLAALTNRGVSTIRLVVSSTFSPAKKPQITFIARMKFFDSVCLNQLSKFFGELTEEYPTILYILYVAKGISDIRTQLYVSIRPNRKQLGQAATEYATVRYDAGGVHFMGVIFPKMIITHLNYLALKGQSL